MVTSATSLAEHIADAPTIQTQEKIIEVPEVLEKELDDVMNLIMLKVGSGGSRDVAGGTAGESLKNISGDSAEDCPSTLSAVQDDVEAVACGSHPRERSDEHVCPAAVQTLVDLTLERNMKTTSPGERVRFLVGSRCEHEHD